MILGSISDTGRVERLFPIFKQVFDYVRSHDLTQVPAGRITLSGTDVYINVDDATLRRREEQVLEVHKRYIDIHFPLSGSETVGWLPTERIAVPSLSPFDVEKDFAFFPQAASTYMTVAPGDYYVMFPHDAHAPIIGEGSLRKAIAKVAVAAIGA